MKRAERVKQAQENFNRLNIRHLYGGGPKSKGTGFWLAIGAGDYPETLENDGRKSGNKFFWMLEDCELLIKQLDAHSVKLESFKTAMWWTAEHAIEYATEAQEGWEWLEDKTHWRVVTAVCPHPPSRLYAWEAQGVLCIGCCECGEILSGGIS